MCTYTAKHIGWLLSCLSPGNFEKGKLLLLTLTKDEKDIAEAYARECVREYTKAGSSRNCQAYLDHEYNEKRKGHD